MSYKSNLIKSFTKHLRQMGVMLNLSLIQEMLRYTQIT